MDLSHKLAEKLKGLMPTWKLRPEILLCANTVKPLHGLTPRTILGKDWWDRTRKEAYRSTDYHCIACGISKWEAKKHKWLEGHEVYSIDYTKGRQVYIETVPLCHYCHNYIHNGRLEALMKKGEVSKQEFKDILQHGSHILLKHGLTKPAPYMGKDVEWRKWRLVIDGIEYPPIYKSYSQWLEKFSPLNDI